MAAYEPVGKSPGAPTRSVSVVTINSVSSSGKVLAQGTGFFISANGDVITSRHLLDSADRVDVVAAGNTVSAADRIVAEDADGDLVRLTTKTPARLVHPLTVRQKRVGTGEKIMVLLSSVLVSDGEISGTNEVPLFGTFFRQSAPISATATGSPVVDLNGEVVGMVTLLEIDGEEVAAGIPASRIAALKPGAGRSIKEWSSQRSRTAADSSYREGLRRCWLGHYDSAAASLKRASPAASDATKARRLLLFCYRRLGRPQEQADVIQGLIRADPRNLDLYYELAQVYGRYGYYREVIDILQHALNVRQDWYPAFGYMGWAYAQMDSIEQAVKSGKKCIVLKPDYDQGHVFLGMTYAAMGQRETALNAFQQALRINPANADAHLHLALELGRRSDFIKELSSLKEADRLRPDDPEILLNLGKAYLYHVGNHASAVEVLTRARALSPRDGEVLLDLGIALKRAGDAAAARKVLDELNGIDLVRGRQLQAAIGK